MCVVLLWLGMAIIGNTVCSTVCSFLTRKREEIYTLRYVGPCCLKCIKSFKRKQFFLLFFIIATAESLLEIVCIAFVFLLQGQIQKLLQN